MAECGSCGDGDDGGMLKLLLEKPLEPGTYGSSEPELKRLWSDLLTAATRDERRQRVSR